MEIRLNFVGIDKKEKGKKTGEKEESRVRFEWETPSHGQQRKSTRFKYSQHGHFHFLALPAWRNIIQ